MVSDYSPTVMYLSPLLNPGFSELGLIVCDWLGEPSRPVYSVITTDNSRHSIAYLHDRDTLLSNGQKLLVSGEVGMDSHLFILSQTAL